MTGYVNANGVSYYYEITGSGEPLLLLHGGLGSTSLFEPDVRTLAKGRRVIAVAIARTHFAGVRLRAALHDAVVLRPGAARRAGLAIDAGGRPIRLRGNFAR